MCEAESRHRGDPWIVKAWSTIRTHRQLYAREYQNGRNDLPNWNGNPLTFAEAYGWDARLIADEMKAAFEGPCRSCGCSFKSMGHGPADLTVDIINHTLEPFYDYNTRFLCGSCNSRKGRRPPDEHTRLKRAYTRWAAMSEDHFQPSFWPTIEPVAKPIETRLAEQKLAIEETGEQLRLFNPEDTYGSSH